MNCLKKENATEWYQEYKIPFSKATGKFALGGDKNRIFHKFFKEEIVEKKNELVFDKASKTLQNDITNKTLCRTLTSLKPDG